MEVDSEVHVVIMEKGISVLVLSQQRRVSGGSPGAEAESGAALTYLSDAGEDDQAQSAAVEAMLICKSTV